MDKLSFLKDDYADLLRYVNTRLDDSVTQDFERYIVACALKIWGANQLYSTDYANALHTITGQRYSLEQIISAISCCSDRDRQLEIPVFFKRLTEQGGCEIVSHVTEKLSQLLVCLSSINGDFTIEEVNTLSEIMDGLFAHCRENGISITRDATNITSQITERKESSYIHQIEKDEISKNEEESSPVAKSDTNSEPINVTVKLELSSTGSEEGVNLTASQAAAEASAVVRKPAEDTGSLEELLAELDGLVGLETVKRDVHSLLNFIKVTKIRKERNMKVPTISYHLVFTGNPGTGKTTVARLVAQLYFRMGILPQGQLVETDRSALVAGYLGQTAIKTQKVIQQALGGVLFIDEAYSLANDEQDSYGKEAIETILKAMEDHRNELVVIVAGYDALMHEFIDSNPGLASRFSKYFNFPDYTGSEMLSIFERFCRINGYMVDEGVKSYLLKQFESMYQQREEHFGNARAIRNLFEKALACQADRIAGKDFLADDDLELLTQEDFNAAMKEK